MVAPLSHKWSDVKVVKCDLHNWHSTFGAPCQYCSPDDHEEWRKVNRPDPPLRYSVGPPVMNFGPMFAVLDNTTQEAIALCWAEERAKAIVDALNGIVLI
jgi:hypothetical protein